MPAPFAPLSLGLAVCAGLAMAQTTATVNIGTSQPTALSPGFSGFNYEGAASYEPYDYKFTAVAQQLSPGWIRYPAGIASDAFDWQTGNMNTTWVNDPRFAPTSFVSTLTASIGEMAGKGGHQFLDVGNQAILLGAQLIVVINGFTNSATSAGEMAAYAKANHIPVAVWELCNEPYFFTASGSFWANGADYAAAMQPYQEAIKSADPSAVVSLFFSDPATPKPAWDSSVASFRPQYWDAISYHFYGQQSSGNNFTQWMTDENANLVNDSVAYFNANVAPLNPSTTKYVISEFNPTGGDLGNSPGLTDGTLYGAVYAAEFIMRMSAIPSFLHVGMHALSSTYGVNANNRHFSDVQSAYNSGTAIDTATLNYGFFPSAQAEGVAVLNGALRNATEVYSTTVTGGATVPATGLGTIPALYAQAYSNAAGYWSLVITNKSATAHAVTINVGGEPVQGTMPLTYVGGADPTATNTSTTALGVTIQTSSSTNPIPVPAYSVVRVDLNGGITIQTDPPGLQFTVDNGSAQTAPQFLNLPQTSHTIAVNATQAGPAGTQYVFTGWSDGGPASHSITVSASPATYTASFVAQYQLTTSVSPAGSGSAGPSGSYYNSGAQITVTAAATPPYAFNAWSGGASGSTNPASVIMNVPQQAIANFVNTELACELNGNGLPSASDVQLVINQALGKAQPGNDLNGDGVVNVVDVGIELAAAMGLPCTAQ